MRMEARSSTFEKSSANLYDKEISYVLPPKDSKNVCDQKDQANKRRETVSVTLLHYCVALNNVANAGSEDHTY